MITAANDNAAPAPPPAGFVRIVGVVGEGQRVQITDPSWRPSPTPAAVVSLARGPGGQSQP